MAGDIDPLGTRKTALDTFLKEKSAEGFVIETHTDTHAIILEPPQGMFSRIGRGDDPGRYVVEVDEDGLVTMSPAQPRRS
jgi:hypothetical protein